MSIFPEQPHDQAKLLDVAAVVSWTASVALAVASAFGLPLTAFTILTVGAAVTCMTVSAVLKNLPGVLQTWHEGIDYGRRLERHDIKVGESPDPLGPGLRVVRSR